MKQYDQFHDGRLEGLRIDGETVHVYLTTLEKEKFVAVADGVVALDANGFRAGNIILSVSTRNGEEIVVADIQELYELRNGHAGEDQANNLLSKAQQGKLTLLEITPSYGAGCLVLAKSVRFLTESSEPQ